MKRLVLIDGHAIIHRAYHALPPMTAPNGDQVNAVYGFTSMLFRIIEQLKPTHLAVAFDLPQPTFRRALYIAYQANRPFTDDGLMKQFQYVREVTEAAGIPVCAVGGYEADDVIGTIARKFEKEKKVDEVIIVTGDRDILQLVDEKTKVFMPVKGLSEGRLFEEEDVKEYLGIAPKQIIDYKALVGDSSDNYPGVPGIGPKTACDLLDTFGTLEEIYKAVENPVEDKEISKPSSSLRSNSGKLVSTKVEIKPTVLKKLADGYESAKLSQQLATIETKVPLKFDLKDAEVKDFKGNEKFIRKLQEFSFRSLITRVGAEEMAKKIQQKDNGQMDLI